MCYISDCRTGEINRAKIWWVQAEGITACVNCYQLTGKERYLDHAISIWNYTKRYLVDEDLGDWRTVGNLDGDQDFKEDIRFLQNVFTNQEKAGKGKCPYHNARVCFEIMERIGGGIK